MKGYRYRVEVMGHGANFRYNQIYVPSMDVIIESYQITRAEDFEKDDFENCKEAGKVKELDISSRQARMIRAYLSLHDKSEEIRKKVTKELLPRDYEKII
jgi:hypothetical protein